MKTWQFGTAWRDITPPYPVWLHGYSARDHLSEGVLEPISLGCLAISSGERTLLLFACDMIGIHADVCRRLYQLLEREVGIGEPNILLSCSHTHFAPALHVQQFTSPQVGLQGPDPRFVADFELKLVEAARESLRNMRPGRLEAVRLRVPQVLFNRRTIRADGSVQTNFRYPSNPRDYTFSPVDDQLTALRIRDEQGIRAVLVNFGCHPVTGGPNSEKDHYRISADYPFYVRQTISAAYGCPVFFTLGAAGDAVPIDRYGQSRQRIGSILGNAVLLAERMFAADDSTDLAADILALDAETIIKTDPAIAEQQYRQARERAAALANDPAVDRQGEEYRAALEAFEASMLAYFRAQLYPENRYTLTVQFFKIGRTVLIALPFEVLAEISLRIKERFPDAVLVSCAGGYQGYLPLAHEYPRGGYEASPSSTHFVPGTGDRLLQAILDKLAAWPA